jgi:DNA-binding CsgD family transcriptional regulator
MATGAGQAKSPGWELFPEWHALIDAGDPRFMLLSPVLEVNEQLARIEASLSVSLWNMQRHHSSSIQRGVAGLDASLQRKRVDLRYVLPRRVAERRFPLVSSIVPTLRLAPVAHPLLIADGRQMVVGDSTGETVWSCTDPETVAGAVRFFEDVWRAAEPAVAEGDEPPFTRRMVDIAVRLVEGATDREIARSLGVSERTVSADVREMSTRLGARSRAQAIALISGGEG